MSDNQAQLPICLGEPSPVDLSTPGLVRSSSAAHRGLPAALEALRAIPGAGPAPRSGPAGSGASEATRPPLGITGDKLQEHPGNPQVSEGVTVKLDYLKFVVPADQCGYLLAAYRAHFGVPNVREGSRDHYTGEIYTFECGAWVALDRKRGGAMASFPGQALTLLGADQWMPLIRFVFDELKGRPLRVDPALDFHGRRDLVGLFHDAARDGNYCQFRTWHPVQDYRSARAGQELVGYGVYFGARGKNGGDTYLRVYDKFLETKGEIDAARVESEITGERAKLVVEHLLDCDTPEQFARQLARFVLGSIDFRDKGDRNNPGGRIHHLDRTPRLAWWAEIVEALGRVVLRVSRHKPTMTRVIEWLDRSVSTSLAKLQILCDTAGFSFDQVARLLIENGHAKLPDSWGHPAHVAGVDPLRILRS